MKDFRTTGHHRATSYQPPATTLSRLVRSVVAATLVVSSGVGATPAASRDFVWKVSGRQSVVYLVGSVHMLSKDYYPLSPALEAAFKDSDLLVEELDLGDASAGQLEMLARGTLPANQSLDKVVSASTFALASKRMEAVGLPIDLVKQLKPWALAITLLGLEWAKAGFDPDLGLDKHFYDRAKSDGKPVQGLETVEFQIAQFDGMTMEQQDRFLADTLKGLDTEVANVNKTADAWRAGDAATIERITLADLKTDPAMYQRLLVARNQTWLPKLEALFNRRGHAFVVVGAAHLVGPDGLLSLLRVKGYAIEQL